jgi:hypothetical protein
MSRRRIRADSATTLGHGGLRRGQRFVDHLERNVLGELTQMTRLSTSTLAVRSYVQETHR